MLVKTSFLAVSLFLLITLSSAQRVAVGESSPQVVGYPCILESFLRDHKDASISKQVVGIITSHDAKATFIAIVAADKADSSNAKALEVRLENGDRRSVWYVDDPPTGERTGEDGLQSFQRRLTALAKIDPREHFASVTTTGWSTAGARLWTAGINAGWYKRDGALGLQIDLPQSGDFYYFPETTPDQLADIFGKAHTFLSR